MTAFGIILYNPWVPRTAATPIRWVVLALLFFATTINYLDRIVISVLAPVIQKDLNFDDQQYGYVTGAFQFAYTVGFLVMGKLIDRFGTKIGYAVSIVWWSLAAALHAMARTTVDLGFWRAMLGLGEAGNFPAAIKSVAEWFPKKDRAFATGVFNSGTNVAAMIGPPVFVAFMPRRRPSVLCIETARTQLLPRCCCTSAMTADPSSFFTESAK